MNAAKINTFSTFYQSRAFFFFAQMFEKVHVKGNAHDANVTLGKMHKGVADQKYRRFLYVTRIRK